MYYDDDGEDNDVHDNGNSYNDTDKEKSRIYVIESVLFSLLSFSCSNAHII